MSVTERIRINLLANYFRNFSKQRFKANCYQKCLKEIANIARVTNLTRTASCSRNLVANICRNFRACFRFALLGGKPDSSVYGGSQGNWRWNSNSIDVILSSPSFSLPAARAPRRDCSQASFWINLIFCRFLKM